MMLCLKKPFNNSILSQKSNVQNDPNWDTYFDFLLASPLEMKLNATEEILKYAE